MLFTLSKAQHAHLQAIMAGKRLRNFHEALSFALETAAEPFRDDFEIAKAEQREAQKRKWERYKKAAKQREHGNSMRGR